jgi:hypothetical protein
MAYLILDLTNGCFYDAMVEMRKRGVACFSMMTNQLLLYMEKRPNVPLPLKTHHMNG